MELFLFATKIEYFSDKTNFKLCNKAIYGVVTQLYRSGRYRCVYTPRLG